MKKWQKQVWQEVIDRDEGLSIYSGMAGSEVHHIIALSHSGKKTKDRLWCLKNMCVVTKDEHMEAHTREMRVRALEILQRRFQYEYNDGPWAEYGVGDERHD